MRARDIIAEELDPKRILRSTRPLQKHTVYHDWARWEVSPKGMVISYTPAVHLDAEADLDDRQMMREFSQIVAFDLDEIEKYWGSSAPEGIDISDIGYWTRDGQYHPAEETYRQDIKTGGIRR